MFQGDVRGGWFCGSSSGWLIIASGPRLNPDMFLWNPLNGAVWKLPPLSTLSFLPQLVNSGPKVLYTISSYIKRVHVFSPECVVAVVFTDPADCRKQDHLALCTPKDTEWRVLEEDYFYSFSDILFHEEKLYVLAKHIMDDDDGDKDKRRKAMYRICLSKCQVQVCVLCLDYKVEDSRGGAKFFYNEDEVNNPMFNITYEDKISEHLVEFSGQLLVMAVVFDLYAYNSNGDGPVKTFQCHQIQRIEVRKVDGLERVRSIGGRLIMLTDMDSLTASHNDFIPGGDWDESGILFSTYGRGIVGDKDDVNKDECVVNALGFFNMENSEMTLYDVKYIKHPLSINGWHTPKLF